MQEGVEYGDGGHVWICIPQLGGKLGRQYHPFCVASTPADPAWRSCMLLHCKSYGRWTKVRRESFILQYYMWPFTLQLYIWPALMQHHTMGHDCMYIPCTNAFNVDFMRAEASS